MFIDPNPTLIINIEFKHIKLGFFLMKKKFDKVSASLFLGEKYKIYLFKHKIHLIICIDNVRFVLIRVFQNFRYDSLVIFSGINLFNSLIYHCEKF